MQLGKALSIETIAEGIEQDSELSLLREECCDGGQGFLFARPLDAAGAEQFLREHAPVRAARRSSRSADPLTAFSAARGSSSGRTERLPIVGKRFAFAAPRVAQTAP